MNRRDQASGAAILPQNLLLEMTQGQQAVDNRCLHDWNSHMRLTCKDASVPSITAEQILLRLAMLQTQGAARTIITPAMVQSVTDESQWDSYVRGTRAHA